MVFSKPAPVQNCGTGCMGTGADDGAGDLRAGRFLASRRCDGALERDLLSGGLTAGEGRLSVTASNCACSTIVDGTGDASRHPREMTMPVKINAIATSTTMVPRRSRLDIPQKSFVLFKVIS
ncbi:MAG: hypothetical protein IJG42_06415 [Muribaculaceae bacterium]|nr:hypothetical protein [Muribaculaceae bacterium]